MMWLFALLIVLMIGAVVVVSTGAGDAMAEEYDDRPDVRVPADRPLVADDLRNIRFNTSLRGYRASEVDALLARLVHEISDVSRPSGLERSLGSDLAAPTTSRPGGLLVVHAVRPGRSPGAGGTRSGAGAGGGACGGSRAGGGA